MKILAVETSTEACSAALIINNSIIERFELAPQQHTKLILPMIDSLMAEAQLKPQQLDAVAFSRGPGSFTGVRIATGIVHGIALGADLPVVGVSTLASIAQNFFATQADDLAFVAMDARMAEIFWAVYERGQDNYAQLISKESVIPATCIEYPDLTGVGIGSGWGVYHEELSACLGKRVLRYESQHLPRASAIAQLAVNDFGQGLAVAVEAAMPVYLRDQVAKKTAHR
jgi:tRNA threonylcarbamoyladenosine biosynthesis protein TsaB